MVDASKNWFEPHSCQNIPANLSRSHCEWAGYTESDQDVSEFDFYAFSLCWFYHTFFVQYQLNCDEQYLILELALRDLRVIQFSLPMGAWGGDENHSFIGIRLNRFC